MAKVLWIGDAGSPTGFGRVTHEIAGGLAKRGHDISVLGLGFPGDYDPYTDGLKIYRADRYQPGKDIFGSRRVQELVEKVDAEVHVVVHDPAAVWQYLFENPNDPAQTLLSKPVLAYCPVDGYDYPPDWVDILPQATNFVAMSKFGQDTFQPSGLVYHGVDHDDFWPVDERPIELNGRVLQSKDECKEALGFEPGRFLVLRVDTNTGRKDYAATIKAMAPLLEAQRDIALHLHASTNPEMPGIHLAKMLNRFDLAPGQVTTTELRPGEGWDQAKLLTLYNAADLFVSTSRGEGFGLTIAESLACGVPVVAQDCSAIPEVVGPGGVLIAPERAITAPAGQDNRLADIPAFTDAISRLYHNEAWRIELGLAGRKHVAESFRWTDAVDSFHDFIERAASRWRASQEAGDAIQQHERTA